MTTISTSQPTSTASPERFIVRHPVITFLGLAYGISWLLFLPSLLAANGIGVLPFEIPVTPFLLLSVIFGLSLSTYIVTRATRGRDGLRELRRSYTHWRVGAHWYALALLALPMADLLAASLWRGLAPLVAFANGWELLFTVFMPNALVGAVVINLWEEGAWTGFMLPRLQERWGALRSSAMVAVAMGLFHLPLVFIVGGVSDQPIRPGQYWMYFALLFVGTIPFRLLVTWLWNSTRGSVIVVALFHAAFNVTTGHNFLPEFVPGSTLWVYGVYAVLGLIVVVITKGRLAYRPAGSARAE